MIDISLLRRKLMYRSWHRGCKETDILLGHFALKYLDKFSLSELIEYEKIVDLDDYELYCYITRKKLLPPDLSSEVVDLIACFNHLCTQ
ncbi:MULTISPECIES: FAD assembly factor SdhE [Wolbachia]|uniref:FAD assembly factor SdhE n=1 Tax=Wolbachia TaxID=953 RepID=UPI001BA782A3|nr:MULTISPECIES: succinate dehydrogenase assembly factor 2 [unclassified Wolbachia]QUI60934.1 succinate dehydrogenase assembly factor 2 [Wolbachia endosymbiont of Spodoptera picta]URG40130.1 succinate dehydrogenase assembly factor 2 [Wolbachia endosymbiont of Ostrinia furnacalis]URG41161.1 succinate dehydrogenase assembly factor 2 [Wolbachia endosymbiont of Ostrinia scapulalis]